MGYEGLRADRSMAARKRYFEDGTVRGDELSGSILRSWQRCWSAGQQTQREVSFDLITRARARDIGERSHALIAAARDELHELARVVSPARMIVLLTDASGTVVDSAGDLLSVSARLKLAARTGVDMSEATIGTNAIGTALVERGPVEVIAREHYFEANTVHTCAAAPLFAPDGRLIGALDVSGDYSPARPNFLDLVMTSARAIENRLLDPLPGVVQLAFSTREDSLGTPWEGIVAFDSDGALVGANSAARGLLAMRGGQHRERFEDLFETRFDDAVRHLGRGAALLGLQSATGVRVVARLRGGSSVLRGAQPVGAAAPRRQQSGDVAKRDATLGFLAIVCKDQVTAEAVARAQCGYDRGVPVLVAGETGTGKELVARAVHGRGPRAGGPFIAVNCASLPDSLVEAELFGYVEGAFTGARRGGAPGRLELADGGTLFLDEIGDMPLASQAKLLRVLQERCVTRLGDNRERPLDFALLCATHQHLPALVAQRLFREDLYYRINGLCVTLPPLRQRTNLLELVEHLLGPNASYRLSEEATQLLLSHAWPGNLRQLSHVITCAMALAGSAPIITPAHFPEDFLACTAGALAPSDTAHREPASLVTLEQAEIDLIERTIRACQGNISSAARTLGVSRSTLYNKLKARS